MTTCMVCYPFRTTTATIANVLYTNTFIGLPWYYAVLRGFPNICRTCNWYPLHERTHAVHPKKDIIIQNKNILKTDG